MTLHFPVASCTKRGFAALPVLRDIRRRSGSAWCAMMRGCEGRVDVVDEFSSDEK